MEKRKGASWMMQEIQELYAVKINGQSFVHKGDVENLALKLKEEEIKSLISIAECDRNESK